MTLELILLELQLAILVVPFKSIQNLMKDAGEVHCTQLSFRLILPREIAI